MQVVVGRFGKFRALSRKHDCLAYLNFVLGSVQSPCVGRQPLRHLDRGTMVRWRSSRPASKLALMVLWTAPLTCFIRSLVRACKHGQQSRRSTQRNSDNTAVASPQSGNIGSLRRKMKIVHYYGLISQSCGGLALALRYLLIGVACCRPIRG